MRAAFERRAARAELLAASAGAAAEPLRFAAGLYRAQATLADAIARHGTSGRLRDDLDGLADPLGGVLSFVAQAAPPSLADTARAWAGEPFDWLREQLLRFWQGGPHDYLARALLRPYGEVLAAREVAPDRPRSGGCPFCGGPPWIAARRALASGDGAQRHLGCALCGREWVAGRICCAACPEDNPDQLPSFQSEQHAAVRIEACETCRRYVKSIDLTLDARQIPEVDDLVSVAMDLWANEAGFARVEPGLAGI